MSRVEVDFENLEIPRLKKMQDEIVKSSNTSPDETIVTLDNGAMVAVRQRAGALSLKKIWDVHAMNGVMTYRDFQLAATKDIDADIQAMAYEMARQQMTPKDIAVAIAASADGAEKHMTNFEIEADGDDAAAGRPVTYVRVNTTPAPSPSTPAAE